MKRFTALLTLALICPFLPAVAGASADGASPDPTIIVEAQARCPLHPMNHKGPLSVFCRTSRRGNAMTDDFYNPTHPFGIAYSYNCGAKKRPFGIAVGLPGADLGVKETAIWLNRKQGSGYEMVTQQTLDNLTYLPPPNWTSVMDVEMSTLCAFHVVVVDGDETATAAHVPPIPTFGPFSSYVQPAS